uniref:SPNS lysolipid transporter 3, sphingosine-1-phosphate (putative) n=1 Tax=Sphenodon punctatus TaxID=8508 RepID=A0A8D0GL55_SPHPU
RHPCLSLFIFCVLLSAPLFGYLGDRYNRKVVLGLGISLWSGVTLGSSFIRESFSWMLFVSRGLVGAGTASYSTVAPTIIADLFEKEKRTLMLSLFYIFIPVGRSVASKVGKGTDRYPSCLFKVTPCMGAIGLVLLILLVPQPPRGMAEGNAAESTPASLKDHGERRTCWSFVWSSLGVTTMSFVTGALGFWVPLFLSRAQQVHGNVPPCFEEPCNSANSLIFGGITVVTGLVGVITGAEVARRCKKINTRADPIICAVGMLTSSPCFYLAIVLSQKSIPAAYIFIALGEFLLSLNWAIVTDLLLYVVIPKRQSTAVALQIFVSHLLGDAGSPYLIGIISETIQKRQSDRSYLWDFQSLQYSFIVCTFIGVLGGGFFLLTALHIEEDRKKAAPPLKGYFVCFVFLLTRTMHYLQPELLYEI